MRKGKDDGIFFGFYLGPFAAAWMFSRPGAEHTTQPVGARLPQQPHEAAGSSFEEGEGTISISIIFCCLLHRAP